MPSTVRLSGLCLLAALLAGCAADHAIRPATGPAADSSAPSEGRSRQAALPPPPVLRVTPAFAQYPPYLLVKGPGPAPDLASHPQAARYRTRLAEAVKRGPAFAGHLAVAHWPCGPTCRQWAFVDARDGRVLLGPQTQGSARFDRDSRLFIADADGQPRYFVWTGTALQPMQG